jgi:predicted small metal-binding protein
MEAIAFARCAVGDCKFEAANSGPSGLAFVAEAFARHAKQAHGVKVARP